MTARPATRPSSRVFPPPARGDNSLRPLEIVTLVHVAVLLLCSSWAFGGGADWSRRVIAWWGSLGVLVAVAAIRSRVTRGERVRQTLLWLFPVAAFNVLVLLSCTNPSFSERSFSGQSVLAFTGAVHAGLPSTAHPATSLEHLGVFDAIYLACFNLALAIRRRRALRLLLLVAVVNTALLAVFGTLQKLTSNGLFFGRVPAPNPRFFATFVYANHWAAFAVLMVAAAVGLAFYHARHAAGKPARRGAVAMGIIASGLIGITLLLAGSRSGTVLVILLLSVALAHALRRIQCRPQSADLSRRWSAIALLLIAITVLASGAYLGRAVVAERWQDTQGQWEAGPMTERLKLYSDTWKLASDHPAVGWGLGNYDKALQLLRPRPLAANRQYEHSYVDAHSDWLQSLAEVGFGGTAMLLLSVLWPLLSSRALVFAGPLPAYLLGGCGLILLYSAVEFPFANPAVMVAFWLDFFCAIQFVRLSSRARASR